jgi:AcrR family transcriptional regulator
LLAVALKLFYEKGYSATTLQDIADIMGFSKPAVYYYTKNKEELLLDIYAQIVVPAITRAEEIAARSGSGADRFDALVRQHLATFLDNVEANVVFEVHLSSISREAAAKVQEWGRVYGNVLALVYRDGIEDGSLRAENPSVAVNAVLGMCNTVHRWYRPSGQQTADELVEAILGILSHGYVRHQPT